MAQVKEITVFSVGNATELKAWSNVPYFFTRTLEEKQIKVNRIDIEENKTLDLIYRYSVYSLLKLLYKNTQHTYFRSGLNYRLTNLKIKKALKRHSSADRIIFLTFSFSSKQFAGTHVTLFSDWSYLYFIRNFQKREPYWFEKKALAREKKNIETANTVLSLFPNAQAFNLEQYANKQQHYLGNVINANYPLDKDRLFADKPNSSSFVFIGNKKYLSGAEQLIRTFKVLAAKNPSAQLHIIGMSSQEIGTELPGLFCQGYLDKGIAVQNALYYKLISEARAVINTHDGWGGFSAVTEAMYFYTPVITSPYGEFLKTYGSSIDFGYYVTPGSDEELLSAMEGLLSCSKNELLEMMERAHDRVKEFTWSGYVDKVLSLIS